MNEVRIAFGSPYYAKLPLHCPTIHHPHPNYTLAYGLIVIFPLVLDILGVYQLVTNTQVLGVPSWLWFLLASIMFLFIPFIVFHKVRVQRDEYASRLGQDGIAKAYIVVSFRSYEFVSTENGGLQLLFLPRIDAMPAVRIEDIILELKGERHKTNWQPMDEARTGEIGAYIKVDIPMLKPGNYQIRIIACIANKEHSSEPITVKYSQSILGKPVYLH